MGDHVKYILTTVQMHFEMKYYIQPIFEHTKEPPNACSEVGKWEGFQIMVIIIYNIYGIWVSKFVLWGVCLWEV